MNKILFLFISVFLIILSIFDGLGQVDLAQQFYWSIFFIALLGIPHGAIDHVIFMEGNKHNALFFYSFYFGLMGLYIASWLFFPLLSFVFFLLLSAYHFGQSQFSQLGQAPKTLRLVLYLFWGVSILSGLVVYNHQEILEITNSASDLAGLANAFHLPTHQILLPIATAISLGTLLWLRAKKMLTTEKLMMEIYILALIHFSFYALPFLVGFTLYFVTLHSLKVLREEFSFLKARRLNFSVGKFLKLLLPFTLLSVVGSAFILLVSYLGWLQFSNILLILMLISVLTLPHSIVMEGFYQKLMQKVA
jgi:Brp/Blh family beta-carotene 15,15'-monooxygenase